MDFKVGQEIVINSRPAYKSNNIYYPDLSDWLNNNINCRYRIAHISKSTTTEDKINVLSAKGEFKYESWIPREYWKAKAIVLR